MCGTSPWETWNYETYVRTSRDDDIWSICSYSGGRTSDAFLQFLEEKIEQDRGFARIESLDQLASAFLTASDKAGASATLKAASEKLDDLQRGAGELYAKFAEKASTKVRSRTSQERWTLNSPLDYVSQVALYLAWTKANPWRRRGDLLARREQRVVNAGDPPASMDAPRSCTRQLQEGASNASAEGNEQA